MSELTKEACEAAAERLTDASMCSCAFTQVRPSDAELAAHVELEADRCKQISDRDSRIVGYESTCDELSIQRDTLRVENARLRAELEAARERLPKCCTCGTTEGLSFEPDPYAQEINGDDTPVWECASCRYESAMDV